MTFTPPLPWTTLAEIAGGLAALTIVAYILKLRRRQHEIPFSKLWQRVLSEKESSSLWRRLKRFISLAIQLVFLALLLSAAVDPKIGNAENAGRNVVVIVDGSASMKAKAPAPQKPRGFNTASSQISYLAKKWRIFFKIDPDRRGPVQER